MAMIESHCKCCNKYLGKPYREVHKWLDEFAGVFPIGFFNDYHRSFRHNSYGIQIIRARWGLEAEKACKLHLVQDVYGINYKWSIDVALGKYPKAVIFLNNLNNMEPIVHQSTMEAWIKEGFSLVSLATRKLVNVRE